MVKYPQESEQLLVHTGQHYDDNMSKVFFEDLELPQPGIYLRGSHAAGRMEETLCRWPWGC
jgi:UDP-N-acetylglucosamine 2-epimerase